MKLYLTNTEMKLVRDALYCHVDPMIKKVKEKDIAPSVSDALEESIAADKKLISYLDDLIEDDL